MIRQPIVVVLGHVDSGKTSLLDRIRGTAVSAREVGGITQHIGASFFPMETLREVCGPLLKRVGAEVEIPGLLVIDTPGHEVFTNLRIRGGSAADIAILVVDVMKGFEVQTYESIEILKSRRVPFLVALNKVDTVPGWITRPAAKDLNSQPLHIREDLDGRIYGVVGTLSRLEFNAEAFWRVKDFTKEIAIVPVSAKIGFGIPDLVSVLVGLTQQYMRTRLTVSKGPPRGIILEVREEVGLGPTMNVILIEGQLSVGDQIVVAKRDGPMVTRTKALLMPKPLDEMRDPTDKFTSLDSVVAAVGVKLVAPELEGVLPGSPILGLGDGGLDEAKEAVAKEVKSVLLSTDKLGVVVKADTLGSLEALTELLKRRSISVRMADIGPISRRDIIEASLVRQKDSLLGVILAFGVKILPEAQGELSVMQVKVFSDPIIYNLIETFTKWIVEERQRAEEKEFLALTPPCEFRVLKGMVFRRRNPAIFGIEVLSGRLRQKTPTINGSGEDVGTIHQIQEKGQVIAEAEAGSQVAISMNEPIVGRHVREGEVMYSLPRAEEAKLLLEKFKARLSPEEIKTLEKTIELRRKGSPLYPL